MGNNMKSLLLIIIFFLTPIILTAGAKAPEMITDRPDQTESSSVIPRYFLQIETGFVAETDEFDSQKRTSLAYNTTLLRYGLLENFELRLGLEYLGEEIENDHDDSKSSIDGISPLHIGFKVKIADEKGWAPEIALLGGLDLPFPAQDELKPDYSAAFLRFAFSRALSDNISLGCNLGAQYDGNSAAPEYFYSAALGIGIFENLGAFIESYGLLRDSGDASHMADAGFTYLIAPNFQLDVSAGVGVNENAPDSFFGFGLSWRVPE